MLKANLNNPPQEVLSLHPQMQEAFEWIREHFTTAHTEGRRQHVIREGELFINIDTAYGVERSEQIVEVHRQYIDLHIPTNIPEIIGYIRVEDCANPIAEFDTERDFQKFNCQAKSYITVGVGEFCMMAPGEGHAPLIAQGEIRKFCVKIKAI